MNLNIAKEYTKYPGGRYVRHGDNSGEDFREKILKLKYAEAKINGDKLIIDFDGGYGYATSFLEEAFGGLVRELKDPNIPDQIELVSAEEPEIIIKVKKYIDDAVKELR